MTTLRETLTAVSGKCPEAGWLVTEDDAGAAETLQLLEIPLQRLSRTKREALLREVLHGDEKNVVATLRELVAYEWLHMYLCHSTQLGRSGLRPSTAWGRRILAIARRTSLIDSPRSITSTRTSWTPWCSSSFTGITSSNREMQRVPSTVLPWVIPT